jgi:hypothetical protein
MREDGEGKWRCNLSMQSRKHECYDRLGAIWSCRCRTWVHWSYVLSSDNGGVRKCFALLIGINASGIDKPDWGSFVK